MTKRNKEKYLRMRSRISSRGFDRGRIKEGGCIVGRVERVLTAGTLVADGWWYVYLRSAWSSPKYPRANWYNTGLIVGSNSPSELP